MSTTTSPDSSIKETIKDTIEETVKGAADTLSERVRPHIEEGKRRLESINSKARSLIHDHPAACLLGAVALGYIAARLARRERS